MMDTKKKKEKRIPVVYTYCYYNPLFLKLVRRENLEPESLQSSDLAMDLRQQRVVVHI